MTLNIYGVEKDFQSTREYPIYNFYALKVVDEEKQDNFDLLLLNKGKILHYTYIKKI